MIKTCVSSLELHFSPLPNFLLFQFFLFFIDLFELLMDWGQLSCQTCSIKCSLLKSFLYVYLLSILVYKHYFYIQTQIFHFESKSLYFDFSFPETRLFPCSFTSDYILVLFSMGNVFIDLELIVDLMKGSNKKRKKSADSLQSNSTCLRVGRQDISSH